MPKHTHDTDAGFDLRYSGKDAIKLKPYLRTCINLKIALEIPATTIVQLISRSSLAKKGINIKEGIIDAGYIENIIAILQNGSKKTYTIEPNKKIAQTIFLFLVKVAQLVSVENRKELKITIKGIQRFGSMNRIDIPINMVEEKVIDKREIISTHQSISIPLYDQYMLAIKRKVKNQIQIFEAEAILCESGEIGLVNLYIPAKNHKHIKIPIHNNTEHIIEHIIEIPKKTIIKYLGSEVEDQPPNLDSGYWQVAMKLEDKEKTAFTIQEKNFEFEVMPFGLINASVIFQ
ncbi:hypothetical protein G9A89_021563 [Geosiphon pyriformis]|nr:hypothetical protein G9A89_021563 [Geosiphon pyriformis]